MLNRVLRITIVVVLLLPDLYLQNIYCLIFRITLITNFMATAFSALLLQQSYQAVSEFLFLAVWAWHWRLLLSVK